jgi:hypothetical protein
MVSILSLGLLVAATAFAVPYRMAPPQKMAFLSPENAHTNHAELIVKLVENKGLSFINGRLNGPPSPLHALLSDAIPHFRRSADVLAADRAKAHPKAVLADLSLYVRIAGGDLSTRRIALLADPRVEFAYFSPNPVAPPVDIPPDTPLFEDEQHYRGAGEEGMGFDIAQSWPGAGGEHIWVSDIEYGFDPSHEAFNEIDIGQLNHPSDWYQFHGNGVLGIMASPANSYGVTGLIPGAQFSVVSPFTAPDVYNVADAINIAAAELVAGDVLLIEQQGYILDTFTPVEVYPDIFDAIASAVALGIVVIEPAGNGGCDLDDPMWEDWFDRDLRDSGAIMVGGGASPYSDFMPRSWYPGGSCFGGRVDVQGWFDAIVTASSADGEPNFVDLFYPGGDTRQAYTTNFGGTSGAAALVASIAAAMNSMAIETRRDPFTPMDLRAAMISTGHPQTESESQPIGPQPDLRRLMRIWGVR